jgi:hypothetical protein
MNIPPDVGSAPRESRNNIAKAESGGKSPDRERESRWGKNRTSRYSPRFVEADSVKLSTG